MKKTLIFLTLFMIIFSNILLKGKEADPDKIIKRKILILPFQNINEVSKYKFLSTSLRDALNAELLASNLYIILSFSEIYNEMQQMGIDEKDIIDETNANKLAIKMKADVIIIGTYIILNDRIKLQMKAIDVHEKQTIVSINMEGDADLDTFRIIDDSVKDMAQKMIEKLPPITDDYFIQQRKLLRQKLFTPKIRTGIGLTVSGGLLILIGIPILAYDVAGYSSIVKDNLYGNPRTSIGYQEYLKTNYTHIALLVTSLSMMGIGITLISIGIPLIIYDTIQVKKKLAINLEIDNEIKFYLKIEI